MQLSFQLFATCRQKIGSVRLPDGIAAVAAAIFITLLVVPRPTLTIEIRPDQIRPEVGRSYQAPNLFGRRFLYITPTDTYLVMRSRLSLFEDGVALGPAHAVHQRIRDTGGGAFSYWSGSPALHWLRNTLYFSSRDGTDPRSNGRHYVARVRTEINPLVLCLLVIAALGLRFRSSLDPRLALRFLHEHLARSAKRFWPAATLIGFGLTALGFSKVAAGTLFLFLMTAGLSSAPLGLLWLISGLVEGPAPRTGRALQEVGAGKARAR